MAGFIAQSFPESRSAIIRLGGETFEEIVERCPKGYVVHEYLPSGWQPIWTADLAREFSLIGCDHIGDAELQMLHESYVLTRAQQALLSAVDNPRLKLIMRDTLVPRHFSRLIFQRTPDHLPEPKSLDRLDGWVGLNVKACNAAGYFLLLELVPGFKHPPYGD